MYEAISLDFIWRLLVPLRDPRFIATIDGIEDVQKQLMGAKRPGLQVRESAYMLSGVECGH